MWVWKCRKENTKVMMFFVDSGVWKKWCKKQNPKFCLTWHFISYKLSYKTLIEQIQPVISRKCQFDQREQWDGISFSAGSFYRDSNATIKSDAFVLNSFFNKKKQTGGRSSKPTVILKNSRTWTSKFIQLELLLAFSLYQDLDAKNKVFVLLNYWSFLVYSCRLRFWQEIQLVGLKEK